jgi:nicotinamide-nucleotide amidase
MVKLRLSIKGENQAQIKKIVDKEVKILYNLTSEYIYGEEELGKEVPTFQCIIGKMLLERNQTLTIAESCTGGYISHLITSVAGSSAYYKGSVIAYENEIKINQLNVNPDIIKTFGAVSLECAEEMAKGILKTFNTDYAIATTGLAGPTGETPDKPIGTVCIAIATKHEVQVQRFIFGNNRERNIRMAADMALSMLKKVIPKS